MTEKGQKSRKRPKLPQIVPACRLSSPSQSTTKLKDDRQSFAMTIVHSDAGTLSALETKAATTLEGETKSNPNPEDSVPLNTAAAAQQAASASQSTEQTTHTSEKLKRKRENTVKSRLTEWLEMRDSTLDEILRHDGLAASSLKACTQCHGNDAKFRCNDCGHGKALYCKTCLVSRHRELELHRIEAWTGEYFQKLSLSELGLRIQLGHDGSPCPCPAPGPLGFIVFDISGAHEVDIDYCTCNGHMAIPKHVQLLRRRWFPATQSRPRTVFTFDCLDTFHEGTLQGKGNLYDFYNMLLRKTDNANLRPSIHRLPEFHRVFRLWRNMMAWKRAGRGHDPSGIAGTSPGGLTTECPACPHPGRNLPDNWQDAGPLLYLYTLFIAVDANFKLKGKDRKLQDVDLLGNSGVFVDEDGYQEYIKDYKEQPEINTCRSDHDAIVRASSRANPRYAVNGAGLTLCSRHSLVRRNGVGDLQKGERYCNMDFIIFSALMGLTLLRIFITYDIACQWSKNLEERMKEFPEHMKIPNSTKIDTAVPSWHINGHGPFCRRTFCIGYMPGVGRTCGEEVEISWSHTNPLAASVREMAPIGRHDTLNDHWNGWNFRKVVGFRISFLKKFKEAGVMQDRHKKLFEQLSATFPAKYVKQWKKDVEAWEEDRTAPNPYEEPEHANSLQEVRLELAKEEAAEVSKTDQNLSNHKVSMTKFLTSGLDLEDRQYQLRYEISQRKLQSAKEQADILEKRTGLQHQLNIWRQIQLAHTPHVANVISSCSSVDENGAPRIEVAEDAPLYLPSALSLDIRGLPEMKRVCNMEMRLRKGEANDALLDIRRGRRNITKLWRDKKVNVSGTGNRPNTRMLTIYTRLENKVRRAAAKYRRAHRALLILDPDGDWKEDLHALRNEDIRGPGLDPHDRTTSKGRFEESWIWLTARKGGRSSNGKQDDEEFYEDMRVEWAKSRARMMRWEEEYLIVQEEMRRVIVWFEWKAGWWESQAALRTQGDQHILDGIIAYAHKQANIQRQLASRCAQHWLPILTKFGAEPAWATRYKDKANPFAPKKVRQHEKEAPEEENDIITDGIDVGSSEEDTDSDREQNDLEDEVDDFNFDD